MDKMLWALRVRGSPLSLRGGLLKDWTEEGPKRTVPKLLRQRGPRGLPGGGEVSEGAEHVHAASHAGSGANTLL